MRSYPRNSPEAAARIVALIMVADGHVSRSETAALDRLHASTLLDIAPADMARVLRLMDAARTSAQTEEPVPIRG